MQRELRDSGAAMKATDRQSFVDAFEKGELIRPEVPGGALARLVVQPARELSGKFLKYGSPSSTGAKLTGAG
jgi:hypothetical protein